MINYIFTPNNSISGVHNHKAFTIARDHPRFGEILQALRDGNEEVFLSLIDLPVAIVEYTQGLVSITGGVVHFNGKAMNTALTKRMLELMNLGYPFQSLVFFMHNLMLNPSKRAVEELYPWLEHRCIPITEDGCFLGYKYLNLGEGYLEGEPQDKQIYVDVYTGKIRQWVGGTVKMNRNEVDDNWGVACSEGFHVGSSEYPFHGQQRVIVKVNPRDVVSVPASENKLRSCEYILLDLFGEVYTAPITTPAGSPVPAPNESVDDSTEDDDELDEIDDDDSSEPEERVNVSVRFVGTPTTVRRDKVIDLATLHGTVSPDEVKVDGDTVLTFDMVDMYEAREFAAEVQDYRFVYGAKIEE